MSQNDCSGVAYHTAKALQRLPVPLPMVQESANDPLSLLKDQKMSHSVSDLLRPRHCRLCQQRNGRTACSSSSASMVHLYTCMVFDLQLMLLPAQRSFLKVLPDCCAPPLPPPQLPLASAVAAMHDAPLSADGRLHKQRQRLDPKHHEPGFTNLAKDFR